MVVAALLTAVPGLLVAAAMSGQGPSIPLGPAGRAVSDRFVFVHQPLTGDGSITVRVTSLTGLITYPPPNHDQIVPGVVPWAKAGVIVKDGLSQGSAYAAVMVTGSRGVRMQYDFTEDRAGLPGSVSTESPRWLRLTRSGDTLIGYESTDGARWSEVGTAHLAGLSPTVQAGLFVTSPGDVTLSEGASRFTSATAVFDHLEVQGVTPSDTWRPDDVGAEPGLPSHLRGRAEESGGTFTVTGNGDISPLGAEDGWTVERTLVGVVAGLIAVIVVAVRFVTADHLGGSIHDAQLASARQDWVLAAKAIVIGAVTFASGLAAATVAVPLGSRLLLSRGVQILPVTQLTEWRVVLGTAALLAMTAVFALALGTLFRVGVAAIFASVALVVLPYILAFSNVLPLDASRWLLRLTPAAGFSIQQSIPEYPQVIGLYIAQVGYYPLPPWAGFAVLCGYALLALGLGVCRLHRRNA
jgi:hypothetical protein